MAERPAGQRAPDVSPGSAEDHNDSRRSSPNEWAEKRSPAQSNERADRNCSVHQKRIEHQHRTPKDVIPAASSSWPTGLAGGWQGCEQLNRSLAQGTLTWINPFLTAFND